jgi:hypothetical protein
MAGPFSNPRVSAFDPRYGSPPPEEDAELMEQARLIEPYFDAPWYLRSSAMARKWTKGARPVASTWG